LDRVPSCLVLRDGAGEDILVWIIAAVLLGPALLDPDLGDEVYALEALEADGASRARFRTYVVGHETERAVEDGLEHAEIAGRHLLLSVSGAGEKQVVPELASLIEPVENGEGEVEHLAFTIGAALEQAVLADTAGFNVSGDGRDRVVWNQIKRRRRRIG